MTRIKVAYICTPIDFGGAEKVSLNFLQTVDRERFDITPILLLRPWEPPPYFAIQLQELHYTCLTVPVSKTPQGGIARVFRVAYSLYTILKQGRFDLVHTHGYFADICAIPCVRFIGAKSLATCHGFICNDNKLRLYNYLDKQILKNSTKIVVVSEGIREELLQAGIAEKKIQVLPNGVSHGPDAPKAQKLRNEKRSALNLTANDLVVGYLGRLSEEKGLAYLVEAVGRLQGQGLPVKLLLVGEGPSRVHLHELSKKMLYNESVIFTGFQENVEQWLPVMDAFALPSRTEGTPLALLEAMAARIPVVASAVGGVPKIVRHGENGLLVPTESPVELADALAKVLTNDTLRLHLSTSAALDVEKNYGLDAWRRKYEQIYEDIVSA